MQRNLVKHFEKKETQEVKKAKTNLALKKVSASFLRGWRRDIQFFREFDPGSGLTLAACITHSSRTECRNTLSGGRVSNA